MKKLIFLLFGIILLNACSCFKEKEKEKNYKLAQTIVWKNENTIGTESYKILPNSKIVYKKDNIGIGYYNIIPGDKTVFIYTLDEKPVDTTLRDAGYKEEVLFEVDGKLKKMELSDKELEKVNLLVGVHGYFRKSGVYKVKKGRLKIDKFDKKHWLLDIQIEDPTYRVHKKNIKLKIPIIK